MYKLNIPIHHKNDKQSKKVSGFLDTLMNEAKKRDEKVMGFIKS